MQKKALFKVKYSKKESVAPNLQFYGYLCPAMKHKLDISLPVDDDRVVLHTCCAPCSCAIIERLLQCGITPIIYYCNPNIYPYEEYLVRKNECTRFAEALGLEIVDADYDHNAWCEYVKGLESEPERGGRCLECFKMRLLSTARFGAQRGISTITTTLASSRWKSLEQIDRAGRWAVESVNTERGEDAPQMVWWEQNWRKGGLQERRQELLREYNFYNQQYCGCEFSMRAKE